MVRSPRATLSAAVAQPRSLELAALIVLVAAVCSVGFLMTPVGRLAALDQEVRQLESVGTVVTDEVYSRLRTLQPYRPAISAGIIIVGWPVMWALAAVVLRAAGNRGARQASLAQVYTVVVHASSIFALRAIVVTPLNYARESLGGATSLGMLLPGFGESTFAARLLGVVDIFALWWIVLVATGLGILYRTRTFSVVRWLVGAYATGVAALALTQALRGGI